MQAGREGGVGMGGWQVGAWVGSKRSGGRVGGRARACIVNTCCPVWLLHCHQKGAQRGGPRCDCHQRAELPCPVPACRPACQSPACPSKNQPARKCTAAWVMPLLNYFMPRSVHTALALVAKFVNVCSCPTGPAGSRAGNGVAGGSRRAWYSAAAGPLPADRGGAGGQQS